MIFKDARTCDFKPQLSKCVTVACRLRYCFNNFKAVKSGKKNWFTVKKHRGLKIIIPTLKSTVQDWVINNPHVIVSPIKNDCVKIRASCKNENQFVLKLLLQIYLRDIHNDMVRPVSHDGF